MLHRQPSLRQLAYQADDVDSMQDAQCKMQRMVYYNPAECLRIVWSGKDTH